MDTLLRMIAFRNAMKVVDLSREGLVATGLTQAQLSCTRDEKDAFLLLLLRTRLATGRTIIFTNAVTALVRLRSMLTLLSVPTLALQVHAQTRARARTRSEDTLDDLPTISVHLARRARCSSVRA